MLYTSTRDGKTAVPASQCLLQGIAPDGGLFVPESFPVFSKETISQMQNQTYEERAYSVLSSFLTDFSQKELQDCIRKAYGCGSFETSAVVPLHQLSPQEYILELWHGPTLAFKDVALQILPHFLTYAKQKQGEKSEILILVATSGDTGKAALEGFCDVPGMGIAVFYPEEGVSLMQKLQMLTQEGKNVTVCAVKGNFDDAQTGVKKLFGDSAFNQLLLEKNIKLSSANSINWGRLVPQIVYYFSAYVDLLKMERIHPGQPVNFVVPTGNFGNILAGYYAMRMGLPVNKFICASNKNNVLTDFFQKGEYDANRTFYKTISPSMDILISSNLERLLFELSGRDAETVSAFMQRLKNIGKYTITDKMRAALEAHFDAGFAGEEKTKDTIARVYKQYGYIMDPHTAVAQSVYDEYRARTGDDTLTVLLSTASPYKFPADVCGATGTEQGSRENEFSAARQLEEMGLPMPKAIQGLEQKPVLHGTVCTREDMGGTLLQKLEANK